MKITKTPNGKRIKLSQKDWEKIGKKAGWTSEAQAAPAKAPTKAPTKTPTKTPQKPGKQSPFKPPRPKITPNPKAQKEEDSKKKLIEKIEKTEKAEELETPLTFADVIDNLLKTSQTYEENALEPVRNFWMNIPEDHPFSQNPILSQYGHNLSQEGFNYLVEKIQEGGGLVPTGMEEARKEVLELMQRIFHLEQAHKDQLIQKAKEITNEIWGISPDNLEANIDTDIKKGGAEEEWPQEDQEGQEFQEQPDEPEMPEGEQEAPPQEVPMTPQLRQEINKRIIMNTLTQGSAVHAMYSVHHLVADVINEISPELLDMYTRLSGIATHQYYIIDIPAMIQMMQDQLKDIGGVSVGWSHIEFEDEQGDGDEQEGQEGQEGPEAKVVASAICFPVLCQELFKGVMELLSMHGINQELSKDELYTVYKYADRLEDEPWLITVGPALWRKFLDVIPNDINLSDIMMKFSQETPQRIQEIVRAVIQNPNAIRAYFAGLQEPEEVEMWQDVEDVEVEEGDEDEDDMDAWLRGLINQ
jgi:hypothetical protein